MRDDTKFHERLEEELSEDVLDLRSKLGKITSDSIETENRAKNSGGKILRIVITGLSIAACFAIAAFFIPGLWGEASTSDLYSAYYEPYPMALNQRGDAEAELNKAISSYIAEEYGTSSEAFLSLYSGSNEAVHLLYAANAKLAAGNYDEAIKLYEKVLETGDQKVAEQAQWYQALALIKLDKIEEAKASFRSFDNEHYKYNDVQDMLEKL